MKKTLRLALPLLLAAALSACSCASHSMDATASANDGGGKALMDADNAFARDSYQRGVEAWADAWAPNGLKPGGPEGPIVGKEGVRGQMSGFYANPDNKLEWHPLHAEIARGGRTGYTWGRFKSTRKNKEGQTVVAEGTYITVWEKQEDGSWKVLFDTGDSDTH